MTLSSRFICYWASRISPLWEAVSSPSASRVGLSPEESATLVSIIVMALILPPFS